MIEHANISNAIAYTPEEKEKLRLKRAIEKLPEDHADFLLLTKSWTKIRKWIKVKI